MDVDKLISEVKKRRPLWDANDRNRDRKVMVQLWEEISNEMDIPTHDLKNKWQNLKDTYRAAIKSGSDKWRYLGKMSFLGGINLQFEAKSKERARQKYEMVEKKSHLKQLAEDKRNEDYYFLLSFLPIMNEMTNMEKLEFRAKMSNVTLNIMRARTTTGSDIDSFDEDTKLEN